MGFDVSVADCCVVGKRKVDAVNQAAIEVAGQRTGVAEAAEIIEADAK